MFNIEFDLILGNWDLIYISFLCYSVLIEIVRSPLTFPKSSSVSCVVTILKISSFPSIFKFFGTVHEYPQVPPQPYLIAPVTMRFPEELKISTSGRRSRLLFFKLSITKSHFGSMR